MRVRALLIVRVCCYPLGCCRLAIKNASSFSTFSIRAASASQRRRSQLSSIIRFRLFFSPSPSQFPISISPRQRRRGPMSGLEQTIRKRCSGNSSPCDRRVGIRMRAANPRDRLLLPLTDSERLPGGSKSRDAATAACVTLFVIELGYHRVCTCTSEISPAGL